MDSTVKQTSDSQHPDKKLLKERSQIRTTKTQPELEKAERRKAPTLPPFQELVDPNDSDMEDLSAKSDVSRVYNLKMPLDVFVVWISEELMQYFIYILSCLNDEV